MAVMFSEQIHNKVKQAYEKNMAYYPQKKKEVEEYLHGKTSDEVLCVKYLYAFMTVNDMVSYEVEYLAHYVQASLKMRRQIPYAATVPEELFLAYVLAYRVNNEYIDDSRTMLYERLLERVLGKEMLEACLEVNYWCDENATYIPADDRTLSPSAMMKKAKGRCGEESTFTVSALRSVGIPARQCYSPRWAHCDDNHAWVEVWVDGTWHYLGACEPEPVLDKGWFTAAASKAMLVHSKAYVTLESGLMNEQGAAYSTPVYTLVNSTATYGEVKTLRVQVLEKGVLQKKVRVQFQLVNYSELYTIYEMDTDEQGMAFFTTGLGDIGVYVTKDGKSIFKKADMRKDCEMILNLNDALAVEERDGQMEEMEFIPPKEHVAAAFLETDVEKHERRLAVCDSLRNQVEAGFEREVEGDLYSHYRMLARGNKKEIISFLSWEGAEEEEKFAILSTLREKDFVDISCETLMDYVCCSRPYENRYPREVYISYILAPRIHNEMILPVRRKILQFLEDRDVLLQDGRQVWEYLKKQVRIMPDYGASIEAANSFGALFYGMCDAQSFPIIFVSVCRSVGIPTRLNPVTQEAEYGIWKNGRLEFVSPDERMEKAEKKMVTLTLINEEKQPAIYSTQFSIGIWKDGTYRTLQLSGLEVVGEKTLELEAGQYRLLTSMRQIDGAVSVRMFYFSLYQNRSIVLSMGEDKTKEKIKRVPLSKVTVKYGEKTGLLTDFWNEYPGLLIVADPGKEPTEHLFQELLEWKENYRDKKIKIAILLKEQSNNETLQRVRRELSNTKVFEWINEKEIYQLHVDMQVGDERLPFAVAVDKEGQGLFAFANYNIRTAQTMYHILEVSE